jgi:hypothetical protein
LVCNDFNVVRLCLDFYLALGRKHFDAHALRKQGARQKTDYKGVTGEFGKNSTLRVLNAITLHNIQDCVFA